MKRKLLKNLKEWKESESRKPLIIRGARQVGKTWLMKEFGEKEYKQVAYVNFEASKSLKDLFVTDFHIPRLITALQIETGIRIEERETLIILDEIQEAKGGITSLKYFNENAPEYHIIAAGSLLGVAHQKGSSFPVGKVDFLDLHPLDYTEFLEAIGGIDLLELVNSKDWTLIKTFKEKYIQFLRLYYYLGGMPEVVQSYLDNKDLRKCRQIQKNILYAYENDFSKHAPGEIIPRIRNLWNSIPSQLAKENKKFIYSVIKTGARAREYELALNWLSDSGLINQVFRVNKPGIPLAAYKDINAFKLFIHDVGLLGAHAELDEKSILDGNVIFTEFKGALTEQYVLQQLKSNQPMSVYYWSAERTSTEIDFLIQHSGNIIPIEVKAEENLQAKSLKSFNQKYDTPWAVRTSMSDYRKESWMTNLPLYCISLIKELV
jgi:predicted AAA+ superfamily ATPase